MKRIKNKAQHEIVGFVLIVVIVVILGLFLLVFYLKKSPAKQESLDVQNFLGASMMYTTDCVISIEPLNMQDLIKSCHKNYQCLNGEMACDFLNDSFKKLVHESWLVSPQKPVNSYSIKVYYDESGEETAIKQEILGFKEGNCSGARAGAEHEIASSPGKIITEMEICYT